MKMALKRELQVMSAENRLKRVHVGTDDEDDELPLLYPFDADQVAFSACCPLSLRLLSSLSVPYSMRQIL